jgi:nicotinamidase-related amidase
LELHPVRPLWLALALAGLLPPAGAGPDGALEPGLVGEYFALEKPSETFPKIPAGREPTLRRIEKQIAAAPGCAAPFYARWTGVVRAPEDGRYSFSVESEAQARLWIDAAYDGAYTKPLIPPGRKQGSIVLRAGWHEIKLELAASEGKPSCRLFWESEGRPKEVIPEATLFHKSERGRAAALFLLRARQRCETSPGSGRFEPVERVLPWDPARTAVILCDVWDDHTCRSAARRAGEMAPRIDAFARAARRRGAFVIHAPSEVIRAYEDTPQRKRAREAPRARPPVPCDLRTITPLDPSREAMMPVDDGDGGCDDDPPCVLKPPYKHARQHPAIGIAEEDAISESGQEIYNLLEERGLRHVLFAGFHTNMCVLWRSFSIRKLVALGKDVVLVRDLTDSLYNPRRWPYVSHERGTELVVEHIEKYWCPSVLSSDVTGDR